MWKLDRFARDRFDSAHDKRILKKNGARVISAKETISQGAEGILMESMPEGLINSVYLYDDKAVINFNGTREARTVSLEEVESSGSADKPQGKLSN